MASGKGAPAPIKSGHCASAHLTARPEAAHARCGLEGCACDCHEAPAPVARRKVCLACVQGRHGACKGCECGAEVPHPGVPFAPSVAELAESAVDLSGTLTPDGFTPAGVQPELEPPAPLQLEQGTVCRDMACLATSPDGCKYPGWTLCGHRRPEPPPDPVADGYGWPDLTPEAAAEVLEDVPAGWPSVPYAGPLTVDQRRRIAAAWTVHDLPAALVVVDQILAEHGVGPC